MKSPIDDLLQQRESILLQMKSIDRLRRGSLSQQFFKAAGAEARCGPYYVLQGFFQGKKFSERVPADQAAKVQSEVDNYRRFQALAETFVTLCDQITRLQDQPANAKKTPAAGGRPRTVPRDHHLPEFGPGKCQFSLIKRVDGGGKILADWWSCLVSCAASTPGRSTM
jgi:hypothetical protein